MVKYIKIAGRLSQLAHYVFPTLALSSLHVGCQQTRSKCFRNVLFMLVINKLGEVICRMFLPKHPCNIKTGHWWNVVSKFVFYQLWGNITRMFLLNIVQLLFCNIKQMFHTCWLSTNFLQTLEEYFNKTSVGGCGQMLY